MSFAFWQRWLLAVSVVVVVFGLFMALLNATSLFDLFHQQIDPVFWGDQPLPAAALAFRGWAYGVMGSVMAGWGVFFVFLTRVAFPRKERWLWYCLVLGVLVWYVPDTLISLGFGAIFNAAFNTIVLILLALPLSFTRREFR